MKINFILAVILFTSSCFNKKRNLMSHKRRHKIKTGRFIESKTESEHESLDLIKSETIETSEIDSTDTKPASTESQESSESNSPEQEKPKENLKEKSILQKKLQSPNPSICSGAAKRIRKLSKENTEQLKEELDSKVLDLIFEKSNPYALQALIEILENEGDTIGIRKHLIELLEKNTTIWKEAMGDYKSPLQSIGILSGAGAVCITLGVLGLGATILTFGGIALAPVPFLSMIAGGRYLFKKRHEKLLGITKKIGMGQINDLSDTPILNQEQPTQKPPEIEGDKELPAYVFSNFIHSLFSSK